MKLVHSHFECNNYKQKIMNVTQYVHCEDNTAQIYLKI